MSIYFEKVISVRVKKVNFGYKLVSGSKNENQVTSHNFDNVPCAFSDDLSGLIKRLRNMFNSFFPEAKCRIALNFENRFVKSMNPSCICTQPAEEHKNIIPLKYNQSIIAFLEFANKDTLSEQNQTKINMLADLFGFLIYHHLQAHQAFIDLNQLDKYNSNQGTSDSLTQGFYYRDRIRALQQLAGGLAHELNSLLCGILGSAEYALQNQKAEDIKFALENIAMAGEKSCAIINNLFKFSGNTLPQKNPVRINQLLDKAIDLLSDEIVEKGIKIKKIYKADPIICLDHEMITQAVRCLLQNSLEEMPAGGFLNIELRTDNDYCVIQISDSGPGISSENLSMVFEPFYSTKGVLAGGRSNNHGLGLSVAYGIITSHCGDMDVTLNDNNSLQLTIKLPLDASFQLK